MSLRASAARYARALLDVAVRESDAERAEADLSAFVDLLERHEDLRRALESPVVPANSKRAIVERLVARATPTAPVGRLLRVLAERDRLTLLPVLLDVYRERLREHRRLIRAEVTTAVPLTPELVDAIEQRLAATTGRTVSLSVRVDPSIVGGVVARIGSMVYDGSIAAQLRAVRQRLGGDR
jgi:F-type H+-transporting ATPase subunit delta